MSFFVRMLEKQKWDRHNLPELGYYHTPADTITADLKTLSNSLSLWSIESMNEVDEAIIALALMRNKLTRLDIIVIAKEKLEENDLEFTHTPENGITPLRDFDQNHYDLVNLNYNKLGKFSKLIIENVSDDDKCKRISKASLLELLKNAYTNQKFDLDDLSLELRTSFEEWFSNNP